jgi:ubiquinone/menaquinone biosynthesis C-methylase UbiE
MDTLDTVAALIRKRIRTHTKFLDAAIASLGAPEREAFNAYADYCLERGVTHEYLAECYATIVQDTFLAQIHFQKHDAYQNSSFAEVEKAVYGNPGYMERYMYGLALTSFLWPNHRELLAFFNKCLPSDTRGTYLEVGPGHGYFFLKALKLTDYQRFVAIDVSAKSIEMTKALVTAQMPTRLPDVEFNLADFITVDIPPASYDAIVMGEVLEHIEDPLRFMQRLYELSKPGGFVFMTTCCNSPAIDHISLFRSPSEVDDLCTKAGFTIRDKLYVPYFGKTLEACAADKLAVNVGYSLART